MSMVLEYFILECISVRILLKHSPTKLASGVLVAMKFTLCELIDISGFLLNLFALWLSV